MPRGGSLSVEISDICQIEIRSDIRSARQHALDARMERVQRDSGAIWLRNPRQYALEHAQGQVWWLSEFYLLPDADNLGIDRASASHVP